MERKGVEPSTSALRTQEQSVPSDGGKGLAPTTSAACTTACTSEDESTNAEPIDHDLQAIMDAWPTLPAPIKVGILALVNAASGAEQ